MGIIPNYDDYRVPYAYEPQFMQLEHESHRTGRGLWWPATCNTTAGRRSRHHRTAWHRAQCGRTFTVLRTERAAAERRDAEDVRTTDARIVALGLDILRAAQ